MKNSAQKFTESEITQDASTLAEQRLNEDQLAHFNTIRGGKDQTFQHKAESRADCGRRCAAGVAHANRDGRRV